MSIVPVIAIFFGIWNTVRKLDVSKVRHEDHPHIPQDRFDTWRSKELFAYNLAIWACFLQVMLDLGWQLLADRMGWFQHQPYLAAGGGAALFVAWFVALVTSALLGTRARAMRMEIGLVVASKRPALPARERDVLDDDADAPDSEREAARAEDDPDAEATSSERART